MSRDDRFSHLERRRPDRAGDRARDGDPDAGSSKRFEHIEPRRGPAEPAEAAEVDPFAPPPERAEVPLELREDDRHEARLVHQERDAHAKAELQAAALQREFGVDGERGPRGVRPPILDRRQAIAVAIGGLSAIALLAGLLGPGAWILVSVLVVVMIPLVGSRGGV